MKPGQYLRKTAAALLALSFVLPMASCDSKPKTEGSHSGKLIEEDMPWFETKTYVIDTGVDPDKYFTNIVDNAKVDGKLYNLPSRRID